MADYDLAVIGGGLNGASIARDAAGRGLRVILFEQGDLGGGASSATSRLIHGDLGMLERYRLLGVRRALAERRTWLRIAPHVVRPSTFVIPAHSEERPPWLLRGGLLLYDRLAGRGGLAASATIDITHHPVGDALKRPFGMAFEYSDCLVDDSRLVVLTAMDAAERGAEIRTGARCVRADRADIWRVAVVDRGHRQVITARALANATGAWMPVMTETVLRMPSPPLTGLVQASQIVVRRLFDTDSVYVFQHGDGRLIFASPYERDFTLIGTIERPFKGDPAIVATSASDIAYLCEAANRYFRERIEPTDVVGTVSGVNPVADDKGRDGVTSFEARRRKAPLITVLGGDVTMARLRAERAVSRLTPFYPMSPRWTAAAPLPGGEFEWSLFEDEVDAARDRWRFLGEAQARRLVAAYGRRLSRVLGEANSPAELGPAFGPDLTGAEVRYLMQNEWARFPDDVLWRRSKLGLTMPRADRDALAAFMARPV